MKNQNFNFSKRDYVSLGLAIQSNAWFLAVRPSGKIICWTGKDNLDSLTEHVKRFYPDAHICNIDYYKEHTQPLLMCSGDNCPEREKCIMYDVFKYATDADRKSARDFSVFYWPKLKCFKPINAKVRVKNWVERAFNNKNLTDKRNG